MKSLLLTTSILALLAPSLGWARANQHDERFVEQATLAGRAQVEFGELAAGKATEPAVQEFGRWMATDHAMANETLDAVVTQEGMAAPKDLDAAHQEEYRQLQQLSGKDFDQAYIRNEVDAHAAIVELYADEFRAGENRTLKAYAHHMLPMLRAQLEEARILAGGSPMSEDKTESGTSNRMAAPETGK